jgi:hypothetical protein
MSKHKQERIRLHIELGEPLINTLNGANPSVHRLVVLLLDSLSTVDKVQKQLPLSSPHPH